MAKKKKIKAKKTKVPSRQVKVGSRPTTEIIVRVEAPQVRPKDLEPIKDGGKYMMMKTWLSERQVLKMVASKTPQEHIYTRPGKGGQKFSYVTGVYVTKLLNFIFGFNWDFEVIAHGREQNQVWVHGKLTVKSPKGDTIVKSQFGRADIKFKKDTKDMLDYGNDLKAATTDALKKCASLLGIASDIYGRMEFKEEMNVEVVEPEPKALTAPLTAPKSAKSQVKDDTTIRCQVCAKPVTEQEARFSQQAFGKILCREHQPNKRK